MIRCQLDAALERMLQPQRMAKFVYQESPRRHPHGPFREEDGFEPPASWWTACPPRSGDQIFGEVWRRYRDWFYVENMHGFDWEALRKQYATWLPYVAHRSDLNYVISEMISELTDQHAYVEGGDLQTPPRPRVALPGARFALDKASGKFRITKIFEGQNEEDIYRSPLTEIGVEANVGDYVLALDGVELQPNQDPYLHLRGKADRPVSLTLNSKPSMDVSRIVTYNPSSSASGNRWKCAWRRRATTTARRAIASSSTRSPVTLNR